MPWRRRRYEGGWGLRKTVQLALVDPTITINVTVNQTVIHEWLPRQWEVENVR